VLNPDAVGTATAPVRVEWTADLCLLYALGVGAGTEDLAYTTENTEGVPQRVLPTLPAIHGAGTAHFAGIGQFDWAQVVHARQALELHAPLRVGTVAEVTTTITGMLDKGSAAILQTRTSGVRPGTGEPLFAADSEVYLGGAGGWGGLRGSREPVAAPAGEPDHVVRFATRADQALLYRLVGDRHPLHSDPGFAAAAGFRRPILHGLCTYGFAGRALLATVAGGEPDRLRRLEARFAAPAEPGEDLVVEIWAGADARFQVRTGAGVLVLADGRCRVDR
jgi:acyl dehydratase